MNSDIWPCAPATGPSVYKRVRENERTCEHMSNSFVYKTVIVTMEENT